MNEYLIVLQSFIAGLGLTFSSGLYSLGGRSKKGIRRFGASFVIAATVNLLCLWRGYWSPWLLTIWPLISIGYHLGYGAVNTWQKIKKRALVALTVCLAGLVCAFVLDGHAWLIFITHVGVAAWSVFYGVMNPTKAPNEEFMISMLMNLCLISYPFV